MNGAKNPFRDEANTGKDENEKDFDPMDTIKCSGSSCNLYVPKHGNIFHPANNLRKVLRRLEM